MADDIEGRLNRTRALANEKFEQVSQSAKAATAKASEKMAGARGKADNALNTASHIVSDHPLAAVAGAAAFGAAIAMLMPRLSRKQNTAIEPECDD